MKAPEKSAGLFAFRSAMDLLLDEVDLALLEIYEMTADAGVSTSQTRVLLRERIEIAAEIVDAMGDDWPDMTSTAYH